MSVEERGESRIYFVRPIKRLGAERGRQVVEFLRDDATFGRERRRHSSERAAIDDVPSSRQAPGARLSERCVMKLL